MANIDIHLIDNRSDAVLAVARALAIGDVPIGNVRDLVNQVALKCAQGDKVRELRITGHGNIEGQYIGSDWIDSKTVDNYDHLWQRLHPFFSSNGLLTLEGCQVGQAHLLLVKLSNYLGVSVRGFRTFQNPVVPGYEGGETKCYYFSCNKTHKRFTIYNEHGF
jgi:hypothetical protein